jgi:hypothetical protein
MGAETPRYETSEQRQQRVTQEVGQVMTEAAGIILMNLVMPNGKMLKDSTFAECADIGGWYAKIASRVAPEEVVGNVLSEEQLRKIL